MNTKRGLYKEEVDFQLFEEAIYDKMYLMHVQISQICHGSGLVKKEKSNGME
jgi:hypothetical protein